jgi:hypothetical protein
MNALHRTLEAMSRILFVSMLTVTVALTGCSTQAPAPCQIQPSGNGPYTIKMTNTGSATASCPAVMGDQWFFDNYAAGLIVMVAASSTIPFPPDTTSSVYGKGTFSTSDPDANDLCTLPTVNSFDGPGGSKYSVTNLAFLSTALYIGTQWKGTITYTPSGGTACTYDAQAINPSTTCASNADCNPTSEPVNSGINYLYDQGCNKESWATAITGDPATGICFFNKPFPSLGGFTP